MWILSEKIKEDIQSESQQYHPGQFSVQNLGLLGELGVN